MQKSISVLFGVAVLVAGIAAAARQPDMVKAHIGHVTTAFQGTPGGQGLLPTAIAEAKIAAQHAALAMKSEGDLDAMKLHAGHVIHAADPSVEPNGPGLGYGVKRAANGVAQHIQLAAKVQGASKNVMTHATHVSASAGNAAKWADEAVAVAKTIRAATTAAEASPHLSHLYTVAWQLMDGADGNKNGRIGWEAGEGGLQQAEMHVHFLLKEGM